MPHHTWSLHRGEACNWGKILRNTDIGTEFQFYNIKNYLNKIMIKKLGQSLLISVEQVHSIKIITKCTKQVSINIIIFDLWVALAIFLESQNRIPHKQVYKNASGPQWQIFGSSSQMSPIKKRQHNSCQ